MPDFKKKKADAAENNLSVNLCLPIPSPKNIAIKDDTNAYVMTCSQGRNKKAENLAKNCTNHQSPWLNSATNQNKDQVFQLPTTHT